MTSLVIRTASLEDTAAMARVHVDTWRTTYAGIVPAAHLAGLSYARCQQRWIEVLSGPGSQTRAFVAEAPGDSIVGIASCGPLQEALTSFDGELYSIYLAKSHQGMGLGRALVTRVAQDLVERGFHTLLIWVLKENLACQFYARLGGALVAEKEVDIGGKLLVDVGYAWPDLAAFCRDMEQHRQYPRIK